MESCSIPAVAVFPRFRKELLKDNKGGEVVDRGICRPSAQACSLSGFVRREVLRLKGGHDPRFFDRRRQGSTPTARRGFFAMDVRRQADDHGCGIESRDFAAQGIGCGTNTAIGNDRNR